jgi:hypothetical protein
MLAGISHCLDRNICVIGQQGYVELEVSNLAAAISRPTVVRQGLEQRTQPIHRE